MEFTQFEAQAREDAQLSALIRQVAQGTALSAPRQQTGRYVAGPEDVLLGLVTYVLFRWAKDYLDFKRAKNETEIAAQRARIISLLVADGFDPEKARTATDGLLNQVANRADDDPVLRKALALIEKE